MAQKHPLSVKFSLFCFLTLLTTATALSQPVIEWEMSYGGSELDFAGTIIPVEDGNFLFSASSYSLDGDFDENYGESDAWLVKIDSTGQVVWSKNYGGSRPDYPAEMIEANHGYLLLGASESKDYDVSNNYGSTDIWLAKLVFPPSPEAVRPCGFQIHPNPLAEYLTIEFEEPIFGAFEVEIINSAGQQMLKKKESTTVASEIELYFTVIGFVQKIETSV